MRLLALLACCWALQALEFAGHELSVPDGWRQLPSPSPALLRFACDDGVDEQQGATQADEQWLSAQSRARRVAIALLPSTAATVDEALQRLQTTLLDLGTEASLGEHAARSIAGTRWLRQVHSFRFSGTRIHQVTWLRLVGDGDARRCLALSCSAGKPPDEAWLAAIERLLIALSSPDAD